MAKGDKVNFLAKKDDEIPEIMTEQPNPWKSGKGMPGVKFDNNQYNHKEGSLPHHNIGLGTANNPDFGGTINFNNTQTFGGITNVDDDNMQWEKKNKIVVDPTKSWTDTHNGFEAQEIDLTKHIKVVGMPIPNINHNSSDDCYGG